MFDLRTYLSGWVALLMAGALVWSISISKRDVSIVDSFVAAFFVIAGITYVSQLGAELARSRGVAARVLMGSAAIWLHFLENWGQPKTFVTRRFAPITNQILN